MNTVTTAVTGVAVGSLVGSIGTFVVQYVLNRQKYDQDIHLHALDIGARWQEARMERVRVACHAVCLIGLECITALLTLEGAYRSVNREDICEPGEDSSGNVVAALREYQARHDAFLQCGLLFLSEPDLPDELHERYRELRSILSTKFLEAKMPSEEGADSAAAALGRFSREVRKYLAQMERDADGFRK